LTDGSEEDFVNPLLTPCKCTGTMGYIHEECFKQWINTFREVKESKFAVSYFWKELSCDLCKERFPDEILH